MQEAPLPGFIKRPDFMKYMTLRGLKRSNFGRPSSHRARLEVFCADAWKVFCADACERVNLANKSMKPVASARAQKSG